MATKAKQKGRKIGRNAKWCESYKHRNQRERNKARKLLKHFDRYGYASAPAVHCYNNLPMIAKPKGLLTFALTKPVGKRIQPREKMPPVRSKEAA